MCRLFKKKQVQETTKEAAPFEKFYDQITYDYALVKEFQANLEKYDLDKVSKFSGDCFDDWISKFCPNQGLRPTLIKYENEAERVYGELDILRRYLEVFAKMYYRDLKEICLDILPDKNFLKDYLLKDEVF